VTLSRIHTEKRKFVDLRWCRYRIQFTSSVFGAGCLSRQGPAGLSRRDERLERIVRQQHFVSMVRLMRHEQPLAVLSNTSERVCSNDDHNNIASGTFPGPMSGCSLADPESVRTGARPAVPESLSDRGNENAVKNPEQWLTGWSG
jgi:hypothetical protein